MRSDTIELLLVAGSVMNQRFMKPSASFNCGMLTNEMILLLLQGINQRRWN
jgi:hypothetical protein